MFDGKAFGDEIVSAVKSYVDKGHERIATKLVDVVNRLDAMEKKFETVPVIAYEAMKPDLVAIKATTVEMMNKIPELPDIPELIKTAIQNYDSINFADVRKFVEEERTKADSKIVSVSSLVDTLSGDIKAYQKSLDEARETTHLAIKEVTASVPEEDAVVKKILGSVGLMTLVADEVNKAVALIPSAKDGVDGKSIDPDEVKSIVFDQVRTAIDIIPKPKDGIDGKSVTLEDVKPFISEEIAKATSVLEEAVKNIPQGADGERGQDGIDGKSVTLEDVKPFITELISGIPVPRDGIDGKSVEISEVKALIETEVSLAVARIPPALPGRDGIDGKDGIGVAGIMIDRSGDCIFTLSNGEMKNIGPIQGKDGKDGINGKDGAPGLSGKDGLDGIGWDDMSYEYRDEGLYLIWTKGEVIKEAWVPGLIYKDIWLDDKKDYKAGNLVTWAGSLWIAKVDNPAGSPKAQGEGGRDWKLVAKKGRDGRDGRNGKDFTKPVKLEEDK